MTTNVDVANALLRLADAIKLGGAKGAEAFKVRSYQKAAQILHSYPNDLSKMDAAMLQSIPGIGKSISEKIIEFTTTGKLKKLEDLKKTIPPISVGEFLKLRKIGPVAAKKLWQETGATNLVELIALADSGKIGDQSLLDSINFYKATSERILLSKALSITEPIFKLLEALPFVKRIEYGGSIRRAKDAVHDGDILVLSESPDTVSDMFVKFGDEIRNHGTTRSSIFKDGFQIDLSVITDEKEWGGLLFHTAGPAQYNIKNRMIAKSKGWLLNDKGLFDEKNVQLDSGKSEEEICKLLSIPFLIPELRELDSMVSCGAVNVVTEAKSDLHVHTKWSDGRESVLEMAEAAEALGIKTLVISDHGKALAMARGIKSEQLADYLMDIEAAKGKSKIRILKGIEANIAKDGSLDYTLEELKLFDFVIASCHSAFDLSREDQTNRFLTTIEKYKPTTIGHPTCEDYGVRGAIDIDWERIFQACVKNKVAIELNAIDSRIGIPSELLWKARQLGCKFTLGSDSHNTYSLRTIRQAVLRAQRAGLTDDDLLWN